MKFSVALLLFLLILDVTRSHDADSERRERRRRREERRARQQRRQERQRSKFSQQQEEAQFNFTNAYESIGSLFPTQAPRDAVEGSMRALKSTMVAGLTGAAALFVFPFALATQLGVWVGIPLGAVLGGISGASVFVVGAASGIYQFLLGIKNTPEAVRATWQGKQWDTESRSWKVYSLGEESEELLSEKNRKRRPQDTSFYDALGVDSSATSKEIKKAYYQKAKELHPDKNPDDAEATSMFVLVHEAYQTLSDEKLRSAYDQYGSASSSDQRQSDFYFNADIFFEVLFGLQPEVELYVGRLTVATFVGQMMRLYQAGIISQETLSLVREESSHQARKRQVEVALAILNRVEPFVEGKMSTVEFRSSCRVEAERISESVFGTKFLAIIGRALQLEAGAYLNFRKVVVGWPSSIFLTLKRKYGRWGGRLNSFRKMWDVLRVVIEGAEVDEGQAKPRITNETIMNALPVVVEMAWAHNEGDIAYTLEMACQKLFRDSDAGSDAIRIRRAEALLTLGQEFAKVAASKVVRDGDSCDDPAMQSKDIQSRLVVAFHVATLKGSHDQDIEDMIQRQSQSSMN